MDVYEQIAANMSNPFSIDRFMVDDTKWGSFKRALLALPAAGTYAMALDARFDVAAQKLYDDPVMSWILMVYNGIKEIGLPGGSVKKNSIQLLLGPKETRTEEPQLKTNEFQVFYKSTDWILSPISSSGGSYYTPLGQPENVLRIMVSQGTIFENISDEQIEFRVSYTTREYLATYEAGTPIFYPSLEDLKAILAKQKATAPRQDRQFIGFSRL